MEWLFYIPNGWRQKLTLITSSQKFWNRNPSVSKNGERDVAHYKDDSCWYLETHNPPIERASEIRRQLRNEKECLATADQTPSKPEINRLLVSKDGRVLNSNQAEYNFKLVEEDDTIILTVKLAKLVY
jgi:hypothetical protein